MGVTWSQARSRFGPITPVTRTLPRPEACEPVRNGRRCQILTLAKCTATRELGDPPQCLQWEEPESPKCGVSTRARYSTYSHSEKDPADSQLPDSASESCSVGFRVFISTRLIVTFIFGNSHLLGTSR